MMLVDVTCRYCRQRLLDPRMLGVDPTALYIFQCKACVSQQEFDQTGRVIGYSFEVEHQYELIFSPLDNTFEIMRLEDCAPVLELNWMPTNLTPKNTTIEKIRTMIVFS